MSSEPAKRRHRVDRQNPASAAIKAGITKVMNKTASAVQMSAEQLLAESYAMNRREREVQPDVLITSKAELLVHQKTKREDYEGLLKKDIYLLSSWLKYADWEAHQPGSPELVASKARAVYERAVVVHPAAKELWRQYALFEMRLGRDAAATRGVLERAVGGCPAEEDVWMIYVLVERTVGDPASTRAVFNRWTTFEPSVHAWRAFARFELEAHIDGPTPDAVLVQRRERVRAVLKRMAALHNDAATWVFYAQCERTLQDAPRAVEVLRTALQALPHAHRRYPRLSLLLAKCLEQDCGDIDGARTAFREALGATSSSSSGGSSGRAPTSTALTLIASSSSSVPTASTSVSAVQQQEEVMVAAALDGGVDEATTPEQVAKTAKELQRLLDAYRTFELCYGTDSQVSTIIFDARRAVYRARVARNPLDVSSWISWIAIEEAAGSTPAEIRRLYDEASFTAIPSSTERSAWQPHALLWIGYALFCEQACGDAEASSKVLHRALQCVEGQPFSFSELWIALVDLHLRQRDLDGTRMVLQAAIKHSPTKELFRRAISLESELDEPARVRDLYEAFVASTFGSDAQVWKDYASFEEEREGDPAAADAVVRRALAPASPVVDRDSVWVAGISAKIARGALEEARTQYLDLIQLSRDHVIAAIRQESGSARNIDIAVPRLSRAMRLLTKFELTCSTDSSVAAVQRIRDNWRSTAEVVRRAGNANVTKTVLTEWREFEARHGTAETLQDIDNLSRAPQVKRKNIFAAAASFA